ncbi:MAG: hypothetical protein HOO98_02610 [Nitrospira sp.]|nr:hypothetical protein [Nitrospira sp.]TKB91210.1 MAG: hypothetical protein E8D40_09695 [Nitrospira sp.]
MVRGLFPKHLLDQQYCGDVRPSIVQPSRGVDAVVNLATISNDPMDKGFKKATLAINYRCQTYAPRFWNRRMDWSRPELPIKRIAN